MGESGRLIARPVSAPCAHERRLRAAVIVGTAGPSLSLALIVLRADEGEYLLGIAMTSRPKLFKHLLAGPALLRVLLCRCSQGFLDKAFVNQ